MEDNFFKKRVFLWSLSILVCFGINLQAAKNNDNANSNQESSSYSSSHALVIGIDYINNKNWDHLPNAENDAKEIKNKLDKIGFKITSKKNLKNLDELEEAIRIFFYNEAIEKNSRLFIWFSGHGHTKNGEGFLVPADAPKPGDTHFEREAFPVRRFDELSRLTKAKNVYMVFDACFSSTLFVEKKYSSQPLSVSAKYPVRQFLCAGKKPPQKGSLKNTFIRILRKEINADKDGDKYVTANEIGELIKEKFPDSSYYYGNLKDFPEGDFVLLMPDKGYFPEMVRIEIKPFTMGDIQNEGLKNEKAVKPNVRVNSIFVGKYEVTFQEYDFFCSETGLKKPDDKGWGRGNIPVINVSWKDAKAYCEWLTEKTGDKYRLPTEAEWEYFARAGKEENYFWGNEIGKNQAACDGCGSQWGWDAPKQMTAPVGSFKPNKFGIYDTVGNVWEWTCSEYTDAYDGKEKECLEEITPGGVLVVIRGGAWDEPPKECRVSRRKLGYPDGRSNAIGFRVVRVIK